MRTLYLCYFGVREPLVQTQVIPYLEAIAHSGIGTHLLTFEPAGERGCHAAADRRQMRERLAARGITWHRLRYHQRPTLPATAFDVAAGVACASWLVRRHGIEVLHARSHVAAVMALVVKRWMGRRFLFDLRGLIADEYADRGHWTRESLPFRLTKRIERTLLQEADAVVTLTAQIRDHLFPECGVGSVGRDDDDSKANGWPAVAPTRSALRTAHSGRPIAVIPCCVNLAQYDRARAGRERLRRELSLGSETVIAYLGSLGGMYLTEEVAAFAAAAREIAPDTRLLAMTQSNPDVLQRELHRRGVPESAYRIRYVDPSEVAAYLGAADIAVSLIRPGFSKMACSPTKIAEYLAAGLPIVSNAGIGDIDRVLRAARVGVVLDEMTPAAYRHAFQRVRDLLVEDPELIERCRQAAREWFDLATVGGPAYVRLYEELSRV